jgi:GT2 family glycosyltransferase
MSQNTIAVAIPTYKRKDMLMRLIGSIPPQWRVFVSDNDSSLLPLDAPLGEQVTVSHSPELVGMFANWNRALSLVDADCTHVVIPSDDDLFLPEAGLAVKLALDRYPDADILIFGCDLFDENDRRWRGYVPAALESFPIGEGFRKFAAGVDARMPGVLLRHDFLKRIGAFDDQWQLTAADSDLVQRSLLLGRSVFVPEVIGLYRIWSGSLTHARQASDLWMEEVALWTGKIAALMQAGHQPAGAKIDVVQYRDEIHARNLLAALDNLLNKGEADQARDFLRRHPVPARATLPTRLRLLRRRLRIWRRAA